MILRHASVRMQLSRLNNPSREPCLEQLDLPLPRAGKNGLSVERARLCNSHVIGDFLVLLYEWSEDETTGEPL